MQEQAIPTFHNLIQFKKTEPIIGLIDIDHLYIDLSNESQNECFIQNMAKQILDNNIWYTGVHFKIKGQQKIRHFIFDHYPQIAHAIQQLDPLAIVKNDELENQSSTIQLSKWLKVNDFLVVQLARTKVDDVQSPFIK